MPGSPLEQKQPTTACKGIIEAGDELGELALATDECTVPCLASRRLRRREVEPRVLAQDRLVQLAQSRAGLDPELVDERRPARPVDGQRLRLPAGSGRGRA